MGCSKSTRRTALAEVHEQMGARMGEFAGWLMPIQYPGGILNEHRHTRTKASLFDICHMGEFRVKGDAAAEQLDHLFPRRVSTQKVGSCRYNFLLNERGTVIDDLIVYRLADDEFFIVVNAGDIAGDGAWIRDHLGEGVSFTDESAETAKLDLQGPASAQVLDDIGVPQDSLPKFYRWTRGTLLGVPVLISRTGYTGERGFEIYSGVEHARHLWDGLLKHDGVAPAGLGARDTLRLEMGYPLYGHELDTETTPLEAGMGGMIKDLDRDFIGASGLRKAPGKFLVGLKLEGRRAAREGMKIKNAGGDPAGYVTSGSFSPSLQCAIAMGFVEGAEKPAPGTVFHIAMGRSEQPAEVVELPFYKKGTARS